MALLDRRRSSSPSAEPFDWLIDPGSIRVCLRPDGSLWQLGSGATGTVFKALLDDVNEVAIKRLNASALANADVQLVKFREEIELMAACRHKNLVQFLGASMEPQAMFMVGPLPLPHPALRATFALQEQGVANLVCLVFDTQSWQPLVDISCLVRQQRYNTSLLEAVLQQLLHLNCCS